MMRNVTSFRPWVFAVLLLALWVALSGTAGSEADEMPLVDNPGFEQFDTEGQPIGWRYEAWSSGLSEFEIVQMEDGNHVAHIQNYADNDARWVQRIDVQPNTYYAISARVRASGCSASGQGATISILNSFIYSQSVYDTDGEWTTLSLFGLTASDQTTLYLALRIGGYGSVGTGEAWFDDVVMKPAVYLPEYQSFATQNAYQNSNDQDEADAQTSWGTAPKEPTRQTETLTLVAFLYLLAVCWMITQVRKLQAQQIKNVPADAIPPRTPREWIGLGALLAVGLMIRLYFGVTMRGYSIDVTDFEIWSEQMRQNGFRFYAASSFCDYPPVYILLLGLVSGLRQLLGIGYDSAAHVLLIKFIPILADLLATTFVYTLARRRTSPAHARFLAAFMALNPAAIVDSAAWGQVDSVFTLLLGVSLLYAVEKRWTRALPIYALAVLTKTQALLFAPLGVVRFVMDAIQHRNDRNTWRSMGLGLVYALAVCLLVAFPFAITESVDTGYGLGATLLSPISWLSTRLFGSLSTYRYLTVNACNLYVLLNQNWGLLADTSWLYAIMGAIFVFAALMALRYARGRAVYVTGMALILLVAVWPDTLIAFQILACLLIGGALLAYTAIIVRDPTLNRWKVALGTALSALFVVGMGSLIYAGIAPTGLWAQTVDALRAMDQSLIATAFHHFRASDATMRLTAFAWAAFGGAFVYAIVLIIRDKSRESLYLLAGTMMTLIFALAPMMHERYLFPAILLLAMAYARQHDRRILAGLVAITITQFMNLVLVLQSGMVAEYAHLGHLQGKEQTLNALLSAINVITALGLAYTSYDIVCRGRLRPLRPAKVEPESPLQRVRQTPSHSYLMGFQRIDAILISVVTLAYTVLAFTNLGSTTAPQTTWDTAKYNQSVVFDLGDVKTHRLTYYGNICSSYFTVALSNDGETWTEENDAQYGEGEIFHWLWYVPKQYNFGSFDTVLASDATRNDTGENGAVVTYAVHSDDKPMQTSRYIRICVKGTDLKLMEVAFLDETGNVYPVQIVDCPNEGAYALIDEQTTVPPYPSYYNGTYFDEIYHARTGYEHLHGLTTYETTHPPLGKVLIMLGIRLFGMTPFGWRFMGTLVGVLMLPAIYLLIKQLTKRTDLSMIGMCLLAFDAMHFTQSRIATIDSYPVLFIMLMYLFMIRYSQMNLHHEPLKKTLVPLGCSGLFMGLACASKWIGIYATAGLAVLFFLSLYRRIREYCALAGATDPEALAIRAAFPRKVWITIGSCCLFFIAIPAVIYYFSYYWQMVPTEGGLTIANVWEAQGNMFNYHVGQSSDPHYFRSPWYQWPVIAWPMWYFSSDVAYLGKGLVSSISCMGNPVVWWTGLVALLYVLVRCVTDTNPRRPFLYAAIGFASQFLPWVLIPRSTFIYHYFASVPFIILCIVLMIGELRLPERKRECALLLQVCIFFTATTLCYFFRSPVLYCAFAIWMALSVLYAIFWPKNIVRSLVITLLVLALLLFALFYPLESGATMEYSYAMRLRWFNWYNFALQF